MSKPVFAYILLKLHNNIHIFICILWKISIYVAIMHGMLLVFVQVCSWIITYVHTYMVLHA